jgi:hypothetical protein
MHGRATRSRLANPRARLTRYGFNARFLRTKQHLPSVAPHRTGLEDGKEAALAGSGHLGKHPSVALAILPPGWIAAVFMTGFYYEGISFSATPAFHKRM